MRSQSIKRSLLATLLTTAAMTTQGFAQTAETASDEENPQVQDTITVIGQSLYNNRVNALKSPTLIIDVPQSLSITTADQIIEQGFDSIGDIVLYTPGLTQSQGEGHRDAVVFRGVRSTADFFIDGVRDDVQYYRSLYNLEQVEVLRGPNALFFGRGGTGGVINRVTKKGSLEENFVGYKASVDTFGAFDASIDINQVISDNVALRVNAYYESLNNHRDFFDGERFGINPTLFVELTPSTTLNLSYEYVDNQRFVDRGIPSVNGEPAAETIDAIADITFSDPEFANTTLEANIFRATLDHQFSDNIKGNVSVSYGDFDKLYANIFASDDFVVNTTDPNILGTVELDGYVDTTQRDSFTLSTNLIGEFETGSILHSIVLGGEFSDTDNDNDRLNAFFSTQAAARAEEIALFGSSDIRTDQAVFNVFAGPSDQAIDLNFGIGTVAGVDFGNGVTIADGAPVVVSFGDFNVPNADVASSAILNDDTEANVTVFSAFIQDEIAITDWLDLVLGVRYDSFDITVNNIETFINTGVEEILTRRDDNIAPRVGLVLKPRENISLYGSFSETFLPRSGEQFADINPPDDALDPNESTNLEVGLKWDFAERLSFTFAAFDIENSSPQENDADPGTLDVIDSEVRGIEAQIQGNLTDKWYISAGYSFLEGNQVDVVTVDGVETVQDAVAADGSTLRLRELPQNTFNLWTTYDVTPKFGLGFGLTYQDESFAGFSNEVTLPSFTRLDATAYYNLNENLRLQVNIENLTDTEYFPNSHTDNNITVGAPLNAKFTISGRF